MNKAKRQFIILFQLIDIICLHTYINLHCAFYIKHSKPQKKENYQDEGNYHEHYYKVLILGAVICRNAIFPKVQAPGNFI